MVKTAKAAAGYSGPDIPDALYKLELRNVTLVPATEPDQWGHVKDKLRLMFRIDGLVDEEGEEVFVEPLVNNSLSDGSGGRYPASTYYKICIALGVEPDQLGNGIDSDELIGLWCQGMIVTAEEEGAWPRVTQYTKLPKEKGARNGARKAPEAAKASLEDEAALTAWWRNILGLGYDRAAVVELSEGRFEGRAPGELTAVERAALAEEITK